MAIREAGQQDGRGICSGLDPLAERGAADLAERVPARNVARGRPGRGSRGAKALAFLLFSLAWVVPPGSFAEGARAIRAANVPVFEAPPITFDAPGLVVLGCNIHDHMLGFVYVLDAPHFGVSDGQGALEIEGVPAGRYRLELRHPRLAEGLVVSREIELPAPAPLVIPLGESPPGRPPARPEIDPLQSLFGAVSR